MASNNNYYGGFTHGGTQYGQAGQYQHQPPANQNQGYTTQPQQQQYGMQTQQQQQQQQQAYAPPAYPEIAGYTRPVGAPPQQPQPQDYYNQQTVQGQQQQAYAGSMTPVHPKPPGTGTIQPRPALNSTVYPTYSANTAGTTNTSTYAGFTHPSSATAKPGTPGFNYDNAVFNAVSAYAAQGGGGGGGMKGAGIGYNKRGGGGGGGGGGNRMKGQRPMPKPQTLHYCDVCKISCAGPQTYKEHLDGQKHRKKEAAMKVIVAQPTVTKGPFGNGPLAIKCELCDVICTGNDAYAAHLRGSKHQKVVKLHTKLGKPIPTEIATVPTSITTPVPAGPKLPTNGQQQQNKNSTNSPFVKPAPPKISFLGPKADFDRYATEKQEDSTTPVTASSPTTGGFSTASTTSAPPPPTLSGGNIAPVGGSGNIEMVDKDIQPVGYEYIEEQRSDDGKLVSFNCKLCECKFNDPNAKEMHMKGRRHRLQYKKKVQPDLVVDVKPSSRSKKIDERRSRQTSMRGPPGGPGGPPPLLPPGGRGFGPVPPGFNSHFFNSPPMRRTETIDDRHVMHRHQEIYPLEEELQAIQKIVSNTEKALKLVSDVFAEEYEQTLKIKTENGNDDEPKPEIDPQQNRILKGVMRVGYLAKGLLLRGDRLVQLVVLCSQKPSVTMLNRVFSLLPDHFKTLATDDTYELEMKVEEAAIYIQATSEPQIKIKLVLTSPLLRGPNPESAAAGEVEATQVVEPTDPLNKEECLDALAALRHAKFFQARATSLQSCVIVIRILRDICNRVPAWKVFPVWALELLAEKTINSAGMPVSPAEALRLIFETISHGILLPGGAGIHDPCEKETVDALGNMSVQSREDITTYAQLALRKIIFRKIHEVLEIESLYKKGTNLSRKRRRNSSAGGDKDDLEKDGKKDKKDDQMDTTEIKVEPAVGK